MKSNHILGILGEAVGVSGGSTANGANVQQWPYSAGDNQLWMLSITP